MRIITIVTKRSVREVEKSRRFPMYYSSKEYNPGDVFEMIDANRKSPAIVLRSEPASEHKQSIRNGTLEINKIRYSKTGPHASGVLIAHYDIRDIKQYIKNSELAHTQGDKFLSDFFPKKRKKIIQKNTIAATTDGNLSTLSIDRYTKQSASHHSELQLFVDEVRNYFGEQARYGQGSFSYYLGMCKRIPMTELWQMFGESKQARYKTRFEQKKLFWWKVGQYIKANRPINK